MAHGTYTLLLELGRETTVSVGVLGRRRFRAGGYAYTGSAFGPGGFARVARHRRLADQTAGTPHWHIDSLLLHPEVHIVDVTTSGNRVECTVARRLADRFPCVDGFGSSDCSCRSHLVHSGDRARLRRAVEQAHADPA